MDDEPEALRPDFEGRNSLLRGMAGWYVFKS